MRFLLSTIIILPLLFTIQESPSFESRVASIILKFLESFNKKGNKKLEGKIFVVPGTLPKLSRDEVKKMIKEHGGKVSASVSSKTSFVVAGENPGSKYDKALKLDIPTLSESGFLKLIG